MDGIDSNKSSLPVNDDDNRNDGQATSGKQPGQGKEFEKTSSSEKGDKGSKKGDAKKSDVKSGSKKLGESESEIDDETTI